MSLGGLRKQVVSNFVPSSLKGGQDFVADLLKKYQNIQVLGSNQEVDSLEHVALFRDSKLLVCSPNWLSMLDDQDKCLIQVLVNILGTQSPKETCIEQKIYLPNTSLFNESGVKMANTEGRFGYNLVVVRLDGSTNLVLLCTESL